MKQVRFSSYALTAVTQEGACLKVSPGYIVGFLSLSSFVDSRFCSLDMGYFSVLLRFRASDNQWYEYDALLPPIVLWPSNDIICRWSSERPTESPDLTLRTVLDLRQESVLQFVDGSSIRVFLKHRDTDMEIAALTDCLRVRLETMWGDVATTQRIEYELDITSLMWRRAPIFWEDDFSAQGAKYVNVRSIAALDPVIPVSPVEISRCRE